MTCTSFFLFCSLLLSVLAMQMDPLFLLSLHPKLQYYSGVQQPPIPLHSFLCQLKQTLQTARRTNPIYLVPFLILVYFCIPPFETQALTNNKSPLFLTSSLRVPPFPDTHGIHCSMLVISAPWHNPPHFFVSIFVSVLFRTP